MDQSFELWMQTSEIQILRFFAVRTQQKSISYICAGYLKCTTLLHQWRINPLSFRYIKKRILDDIIRWRQTQINWKVTYAIDGTTDRSDGYETSNDDGVQVHSRFMARE